MKDSAIVLAAFGTATTARDTYAFFEQEIVRQFPGTDVFWTFTSKMLRSTMRSRGTVWKSPEQIFDELSAGGYARAVIQSLHIVPGKEFEKIRDAACSFPLETAVSMPLLSVREDCNIVLEALSDTIPDPEEWITVFVGHGSEHDRAEALYKDFDECVHARFPRNVYTAMIEGIPAWEETRRTIEENPLRRVKFIPLMFVAGDHIKNDVLGDDGASWKTQLDGFEVDGNERGMGYNPRIIALYVDRLKKALESTGV